MLRSPTFELRSNAISYRVRGERVKIRVIIDGYDMDVYNGLLFGGVSFDVNSPVKQVVHRQTGDISRYKGHRAHIEIVDEGNGWIELDQIVLDDGSMPPPVSATTHRVVEESSELKSENELAKWYAEQLKINNALAGWFVQSGMFSGSVELAKKLAELQKSMHAVNAETPSPRMVQAMTDEHLKMNLCSFAAIIANLGSPRRVASCRLLTLAD